MAQGSLKEVQAIAFDLDGTLYDLRRMRRRLVWRVPGEIRDHGPFGLLRRVRALQAFRKARESFRGSERVESLVETLAEQVSEQLRLPKKLVMGAVRDYFFDSDFRELMGLSPAGDYEVLAELAERGYRLACLSEYPVERKLAALGLADLPWEVGMSCEEVGELKPSPAAFLECARRLELEPAQVLLVGDRLDADVAGAEAAGMPSAWLKNRDPGYGGGPTPNLVLKRIGDLLGHLAGPRQDETGGTR